MEPSPDELISQGRRELVCGNFMKAIESLEIACNILSSKYGDLHESLATPNLLYGTALLEFARMESSIIGNALDGIPDVDDDAESDDEVVEPSALTAEEEDDLSNQVIDAMLEEQKQADHQSNDSETSDENDELDAADKPTEGNSPVNTAADVELPGEGDKSDEQESDSKETENEVSETPESENEEEPTNLQVAWEVIEVAKIIFSQKNDDASKLGVAECLEKLGEISREKEEYDQAIADLKECLEIRMGLLGKSNRSVAESYYQLAATYAVSGDLENARSHFEESVKCLKLVAEDMRNKIASIKEDAKEEENLLQTTLKELETLIPDIEKRCAEIEEDRLAGNVINSVPTVEPSNGDVEPAGDISHLVRKKRPIAASVSENSSEVESIQTNGHSDPNSKKAKLMDSNGEEVPAE
ncbi:unnamed protein product [Trichobilharzia szidati]|nr:unnamed protein product [Trichobilharzia szidati]